MRSCHTPDATQVVLLEPSHFFLVSLSTAILTIAVHNLVLPLKDEGLNAFVIVEHWLVFLVILVLLLHDTHMFGDKSIWMADVVLLGVTFVLVTMLGGGSIFDFAKDLCRLCFSGARTLATGDVSGRAGGGGGGGGGRIAPEVELVQATLGGAARRCVR